MSAYLALGLDERQVVLVDDAEGVALASRLLLDDGVPSVVGMDAEWKPRTEQGGADGWGQLADGMGPVSILQLATRTHVVLLDMLALLRPAADAASALTPAEAALDRLLGGLFSLPGYHHCAPRPILVGFRFAGDLGRLALSYPQLSCFRRPVPVADALTIASLAHAAFGLASCRSGLGAVIETVLGAPLDKTCQCSNWEARPLSQAQRTYAALDAWCLVRLTDVVAEQLGQGELGTTAVWKRIEAVATPTAAASSSDAAASATEEEEKAGAEPAEEPVKYGRNGVKALGVPDVEAAIARAVSKHQAQADGPTDAGREAGAAQPSEQPEVCHSRVQSGAGSGAAFYATVGQLVRVLPPGSDPQLSCDSADAFDAVVTAAPGESIGMWTVRAIHDAADDPEQEQAVHFSRLAVLRGNGRNPRAVKAEAHALPLETTSVRSVPPESVTVRTLKIKTATAAQAAKALGVSPQQIGKSLAFLVNGDPLCVVLRGDDLVDRYKLAEALGMTSKKERRQLTIASRNECVEIFGYPPGSMPPFGHRGTFQTVVDANLAGTSGTLAVGGGSPFALCQLSAESLLSITGASVLAITKQLDVLRDAHFTHSKRRPAAAVLGAGGGGDASQTRHGAPLVRRIEGLEEERLEARESDSGAARLYRFVVSGEMFRLARWLRVIGVDAAGLPMGGGPEARKELTEALLEAAAERRILLTRDKKLATRRDCGATYFVSANSTAAQFQEVKRQFGLRFSDDQFMSRCAVCNGPGFNGPMTAAAAVKTKNGATIPPGVLTTVADFWECGNPDCAKIYWEGPKFSSAHTKFAGLFDGAADDTSAEEDEGLSRSGMPLTPKAKATLAAVGRAKAARRSEA